MRAIVRAGFDHLLFLAMHIPNQPLMEHVAHKIRTELGLMIAWINPGRLAPAHHERGVARLWSSAAGTALTHCCRW